MIYKSCNSQIVIAYYVLFGVKHFAHLKSHLSLLKGTGKLLYAHYGSTYAYINAGEELAGKSVGNGTGKLFQILYINVALYFLNKNNVVFRNIKNKVLIFIGEKILYYIISGNLVGRDNVDKKNHAVNVRIKMKFTEEYYRE